MLAGGVADTSQASFSSAASCFGLARIHTFRGEQDRAIEMCRRTLAIDPGNFEAYGQLSEVSGGRLTDDEVDALGLYGAA